MSKKSKKIASDNRRRKKASEKAAQRAKYESYRDSGRNSKSKRFVSSSEKKMRSRAHVGNCGNIGCKKCFPMYNIPELFQHLKGLSNLKFLNH